MFKEEDVQEKIGEENLRIIRQSIRRGKIEDYQIRAMAKRMKVIGIFKEKQNNERPVDVFNFMLDAWYEEVLCKPGVDGVEELKKVLYDEDVELSSLALRMVSLQSKNGK